MRKLINAFNDGAKTPGFESILERCIESRDTVRGRLDSDSILGINNPVLWTFEFPFSQKLQMFLSPTFTPSVRLSKSEQQCHQLLAGAQSCYYSILTRANEVANGLISRIWDGHGNQFT
jgi:hypothetical protein